MDIEVEATNVFDDKTDVADDSGQQVDYDEADREEVVEQTENQTGDKEAVKDKEAAAYSVVKIGHGGRYFNDISLGSCPPPRFVKTMFEDVLNDDQFCRFNPSVDLLDRVVCELLEGAWSDLRPDWMNGIASYKSPTGLTLCSSLWKLAAKAIWKLLQKTLQGQ
ncbi:hypothetical protein Tco_0739924 [Tanacetum coccineum]